MREVGEEDGERSHFLKLDLFFSKTMHAATYMSRKHDFYCNSLILHVQGR